MRLYLLRHGEIESNGRMIGQTDLPLTDLGKEQYHHIGRYLQNKNIDVIYHSPLSRCYDSARILHLYCSSPIEAEPLFTEINLGVWDGMKKCDIKQRYSKDFAERPLNWAGFTPPQGESFSELQQRAWQGLEKCTASQHQNIVIVSHAGVNRTLLAKIQEMSLADIFTLKQDYGCVNILEFNAGEFGVMELNLCVCS